MILIGIDTGVSTGFAWSIDGKFQVTLHIMDVDGHKRGLQSMVFKDRGGQGDLSKVIFGFGNDFCDELRAGDKDLKVDLVNSYAVVRA